MKLSLAPTTCAEANKTAIAASIGTNARDNLKLLTPTRPFMPSIPSNYRQSHEISQGFFQTGDCQGHRAFNRWLDRTTSLLT
ncbi:hypothetical protein [Ruegeria arenilitoris]|uniref:hypothetical protein n=1 Tax=Ruegeria arenilitoris TaxID=1173585 RepID=UPI00147F6119|nr:hypothetical protein [Ruegeria arenilitoris]